MKADEGQEEDEQSRQGFHLDPLMVMDLFPKLSHGKSPSHRSCPPSKVVWKKRVFGQQIHCKGQFLRQHLLTVCAITYKYERARSRCVTSQFNISQEEFCRSN